MKKWAAIFLFLAFANSTWAFDCQETVRIRPENMKNYSYEEVLAATYDDYANVWDAQTRSDAKKCILPLLIEELFDKKLKDTSVTLPYAQAVAKIFRLPFHNEEAKMDLIYDLQKEWIQRYGEMVGKHTHYKDILERHPSLYAAPFLAAAGLIYFYLKKTQKLKTLRVVNLIRALPLFSSSASGSLFSHRMRTTRSKSSFLQDDSQKTTVLGKDLQESSTAQHIRIPPSPVSLTVDGILADDLNLSYEEFVMMKDATAFIGSSVGAYAFATWIFKKYDGPINLAGEKFLAMIRGTSAYAFLKKKVRWIMKLEKLAVLRMLGTGILAVAGERGISYSLDAITEYRRNKRLDKSMYRLSEEADKEKFLFYAEVATVRMQEYIQFLLRPMIDEIESVTKNYIEKRVCSEYRFVWNQYNQPLTTVSNRVLPGVYSQYESEKQRFYEQYMERIGKVLEQNQFKINHAKQLVLGLQEIITDRKEDFETYKKELYTFQVARLSSLNALGRLSHLEKSRLENLNLIEADICAQFYVTGKAMNDNDPNWYQPEDFVQCLNSHRYFVEAYNGNRPKNEHIQQTLRIYSKDQQYRIVTDQELNDIIRKDEELNCAPEESISFLQTLGIGVRPNVGGK